MKLYISVCMPLTEKLLYTDKFPVFLTLILGLLGYQVNTLTKAVLDAPSIEYKNTKKELTASNTFLYEFTIQNISSTKSFKDLTFNFMFDEMSTMKIFSPDIIVVVPSSLHNIELNSQDSLIVEYKIQHLQPNQLYRLQFKTNHTNNEKESPKIFLTTNDTVRLVSSSFSTWLVKNYVLVNLLLVSFWIVTIVIYIFKISKTAL